MSNIGLHQPLANWHRSAEVLYEKYKTDWKLSVSDRQINH